MKVPILWAMAAGVFLGPALSQSPQPPNPGPVQAELLKHVDVRRLKPGDTLFARMTLDWNGLDCALRTGAILEATVENAEPRSGHSTSMLALSFNRAQCNGSELAPMKLLLAAVALPPQDWRIAPNPEFRVPMNFLLANGQAPSGFGGSTIQNFSGPTMELTGIRHNFPMSPKVKPGDVIGIRGMKLDLGTGPNQSSVLTTKGRHLSLDAYTQLLLVPAALVVGPASPSLISSDRSAPAMTAPADSGAPAPVPENNLETCAPPGCAVDLPAPVNELLDPNTAAIRIEPLGYAPRLRKSRGDFDDDAALAWLSPRQLLLTFNPHGLIHRSAAGGSAVPLRMIRAVLVDAQTRSIQRAVDWEITDQRRYLWPLDHNRVLVHVGNELRVYREGLELERSIPLEGPLAFVRISPNGELLALATVRERHSPQLHAKLREDLGEEPEEDVNVLILDKNFNPIAQASANSHLRAPTLLNEGQVQLFSQPDMKFRLALNTWDHKRTTLARFASRCIPELDSLPPDFLFLLSCDVATGATVYRIMDAQGKLLLKGEAGPRDIGHQAAGDQQHGEFAIKVVHATRELSPGMVFTIADLESEEVRVYRASDGKRLRTIRVKDPAASHDTYALSPGGDQVAVLSGSEIRLFPVPGD